MDKFYKLNGDIYAVIHTDDTTSNITGTTTFNERYILPVVNDAAVIIANFPEILASNGEAIFKAVQNQSLLETADGIDFVIDKLRGQSITLLTNRNREDIQLH